MEIRRRGGGYAWSPIIKRRGDRHSPRRPGDPLTEGPKEQRFVALRGLPLLAQLVKEQAGFDASKLPVDRRCDAIADVAYELLSRLTAKGDPWTAKHPQNWRVESIDYQPELRIDTPDNAPPPESVPVPSDSGETSSWV